MSCDEVFVESLLELLSPLGDVATKRMFGGVGFFLDNLMFALVVDSTLYLRADDENRHDFESRDLEPFVYEKTNKNVTMSYYQAPEEAVGDSVAICSWVQASIDAARRIQGNKDRCKKTDLAQSALHADSRIDDWAADAENDDLTFGR